MPSYVEKTLLPGEKVMHQSFLHWWYWLSPILWGALALLFALPMLFGKDTGGVGGVFLLIAGTLIGRGLLLRNASEFVVTNKRVVLKRGALSIKSVELNISKVEGLVVEQGILGKVLGYGTIVVGGSGGAREAFMGIAQPDAFRRGVQMATDPAAIAASAAPQIASAN